MKATHNIKIDGVWYKAGDELPEAEAKKPAVEPETAAEAPKAETEEPKPKATRRKKLNE